MISRKYLILIAVACLIIVIDQITKLYIHTNFQLGESIPVIKDFFHFTYVRNEGAAFGIFRDANEVFRDIFFLMMPPIAVVIIVFILKGLPDKELIQTLALSGICGGAIGNYIDRVKYKYVIDFLEFKFGSYSYPSFNVADSAIVCGVGVLIVIMFLEDKRERAKLKATNS